MKTIVEKVDCERPEPKVIAQAAAILQQGGLVAFPTETVYGLGGNGLDVAACKKIYQAKGRPSDNPLILHISQTEELNQIVSWIPQTAKKLMDAFWPGPLTLIFPKASCVSYEITGGFDTVAVRFPSHPVAQALIHSAGLPIAAPSANSSGKPSPTRAAHVAFDLDGKIDMILDGGSCTFGLESTILDVSEARPVLLRPGAVTKEMIEEVIGPIAIDAAVLEKPKEGVAPKAPGMKYTHYSPKADVILVKGHSLDAEIQKITLLAQEQIAQGKTVGIMATKQTQQVYPQGVILSVGDRDHPETIGANLFQMLRKFDALGVDIIYSEVFDTAGEGMAIMNRLNKASGYHIVEA